MNSPRISGQQPLSFFQGVNRLVWLPIPLCIIVITILWIADLRISLPQPLFEWLIQYGFGALGILLIVIPAARSFMTNRQPSVLMLGCGVLISQIGVLVWPLTPTKSLDTRFAIYNTSVLISAMCHFAGAAITSRRKIRLGHPVAWLMITYAVSIIAIGLLIRAAFKGWMPAFFIEGQGGTLLRTLVITIAVVLFCLTAALLFQTNRRIKSPFLSWYESGLVLVAVGLTGSMLITLKDSPLQWATRSTQVLGLVYMCLAVLSSMRESSAKGFPLEAVEEAWRQKDFLAGLRQQTPLGWLSRYSLAVAAVAAGWGLRSALEAWVGPGLPPYILFYPAVMTAALLAGLGPGLMATALSDLVVAYWILPPAGQSTTNSSAVRLVLVTFAIMGVVISVMAEFYRRRRDKAAAYDREIALRETRREKEFLANLLEHAAQPFAVAYPDGKIGMINHAYEQLTGYTHAELRAIDWSTFLTPTEWHEHERQKLEEINRTGQPVYYEKEYIRKDGTRLPIELFVHLVRDVEGKPEYYYSFITDISERKRAESAIQNTLQRFYTILSSMSAGVLIVTDEGVVEFANQAICDQFDLKDEPASLVGLTAGAIIEKIRNAYMYPDEAISRIKAILDQGQPVRDEEVAMKGGRTYLRDFMHLNILGKSYGRLWLHNDITERKKAEDAIRTSEERFRAAFDGGAVPMSLTAPDGKILRVNEAFCSMMGYSEDELLTLAFYEFTFPDDLAVNTEGVKKLLDGKLSSLRMEKRYIRKDGQIIWGDMSSAVVRDADSRPLYMVTHIQDITEQKRAEQALKESEERYRNLVTYAPAAIYEMDIQGTKFLDVNEAMCNILGYTREELLSIKPSDLIDEKSRSLFKERISKKLAGKEVDQTIEYRARRKDGEWIYTAVNVGAFSYTNDLPSRVVVVGYDITERKKFERALSESEEKYRIIVETANEGIWITDAERKTILVNQRMADMLGFTIDEMLGRISSDFLAAGQEQLIQHTREELAKRQKTQMEFKLKRKDGSDLWVISSASPVFDNEGRHYRTVSMLVDITERKQIEDTLSRSNEEMSRFNRAAVGRELRMVELKKEVNELCIKNGLEPPYKLDFGRDQP
jgi:PAS domain S-box-containing protein